MLTHLVIHYSEIGTKKGNRPFFERALVKNIEKKTGLAVKREFGRLTAELDNLYDKKAIAENLSKIFGIANFSFAVRAELDIEDIKNKAVSLAEESDAKTFRVSTRRVNKNFPLTSAEVNKVVGGVIGKKADLTNPELTVYIEIMGSCAYVYTEKYPCPGGLPVGASGKVVSLLSGGIDSPVAAWRMMKRGCSVVFVHFHNYEDSRDEKITELVEKLNNYQNSSRLYIVPFLFLQNEIIKHVPAEYRMIVYRRIMLRVAEKIAEKEEAKAFVTGDSLGQVASQTLDNYTVTTQAAKLPVISPLIGMAKQEIVDEAARIGTYNTSIRPYRDCCTYMVAEHPETAAKLEDVEGMESKMNIENMIKEAADRAEVRDFR